MDKETLRRLEKGREHYDAREYDKAEPYLLKVAEAEDGFADVMNMLGVIYHDKGQIERAQEFFERALRINERYTEAALNLAVVYNEQGRYDQAKKVYEHVDALGTGKRQEVEPYARGKLANMHADLGRAYAELQMMDNAVEQYRAALALCPEFVDIRTRLGQILRDIGQLEAARDEFERAKRDRPTYLPSRISLGVTYFAMGERLAAKDEWESVLNSDAENRTAGMYLRMVNQLLAQAEAEEAGVPMDVEHPPKKTSGEADELSFSFDGGQASVSAAPEDPAAAKDEADEPPAE
jgi:tetratricopeptide (TPR) repeat protein